MYRKRYCNFKRRGQPKDVLNLLKDIPSHTIYFSSRQNADIYLKDNQIYYHDEVIISLVMLSN